MLLYGTINTYDGSKLLQDNLDNLLHWSKTWRKSFNPLAAVYASISKFQTNAFPYQHPNQGRSQRSGQSGFGLTTFTRLAYPFLVNAWDWHLQRNRTKPLARTKHSDYKYYIALKIKFLFSVSSTLLR